MLSFTSAGVVRTPRALQIRVGPDPGGLGVAAAHGTLTDADVEAAIRHFTLGQRGPRATPCDTLVVSGIPGDRVAGLAPLLVASRAWGVARVVLHAHRGLSPGGLPVDSVSLPVFSAGDVAALGAWPAPDRVAVVVLSAAGTAALGEVAAALGSADAVRVVATWPLPPAGEPLAVADACAALDALDAAMGARGFTVKGLPACVVGRHGSRVARSRNRFLVDAELGVAGARRYFPEVVAWAKHDACRSCAVDGTCDGAPRPWLESGRVGRLVPLAMDGGGR